MMIKTAWDEVTKKTILNCFGKSEILLEVQTNAMNNHDDPFKEIMDDAEDDCCRRVSVWTESTWRTRSDLASENLDADGLVDFDRDVATNEFCLLVKQLKSTYHNLLELLKISAVTRMRLLSNPFHQQRRHNRTNNFGVESISTLGAKICALVPENLRQLTSLNIFKRGIKKWNPSNCPCRLCKIYVQNVGFIWLIIPLTGIEFSFKCFD